MTSIAPIQSHYTIDLAPEKQAVAEAAIEPLPPPSSPTPTTLSAMASFVPTGGLHASAPKPETEHMAFGWVLARQAAKEKADNPGGSGWEIIGKLPRLPVGLPKL